MQKFIEEITIRDLNKHNFTLGNDFQDNLWGFAINLLPAFAGYVSGIKIKKCFLSESYIKKEVLKEDEKFNWKWKKYSYGLAVEFTWNEWNFETALALSNGVYNDYHENTHCVIDHEKKTLEIFRKMKDRQIREVTSNKTKTIRKR